MLLLAMEMGRFIIGIESKRLLRKKLVAMNPPLLPCNITM
jgi:hypothetical protein